MDGFHVALGLALAVTTLVSITFISLCSNLSGQHCVPGRHPYENVVCAENGTWKVTLPEETPCH